MNLYILRHGLAVEQGTAGYANDADRPLTSKGERKLCLIAEAMEELELSFDLILSSPYKRARQTAEIVAEVLKASKKVEFSPTLEPGGSSKELIELLKSIKPLPEEVMLVGHEPYLSSLISLLISGESGLQVEMRKGGLCKLSVESLKHGRCATLEWLLTPRQLRLMV
jgi:phosphohistidine phosphatase